MAKSPIIYLLTGCTAVGKTELALRWAEIHGAEIVSCDSLLFYRGMNLGTAKPNPEELARVPHHLIDICAPSEQMDIARYVRLAREVVKDITARNRRVLVTGGSGFYLKAFLGPVVDSVAVSAEIRAQVAEMTLPEMVSALKKLNPDGLGALDRDNPRRVARALERGLATGKTLEELRTDFASQPSAFADYEVELVELVREPDELAERIDRRVDAMLAQGLVDEVRQLLGEGLADNWSAAGAIGYREVRAMLAGELAPADLAQKIAQNTRHLVKKQRTWFRTQIPKHRLVNAGAADPQSLFLQIGEDAATLT